MNLPESTGARQAFDPWRDEWPKWVHGPTILPVIQDLARSDKPARRHLPYLRWLLAGHREFQAELTGPDEHILDDVRKNIAVIERCLEALR